MGKWLIFFGVLISIGMQLFELIYEPVLDSFGDLLEYYFIRSLGVILLIGGIAIHKLEVIIKRYCL